LLSRQKIPLSSRKGQVFRGKKGRSWQKRRNQEGKRGWAVSDHGEGERGEIIRRILSSRPSDTRGLRKLHPVDKGSGTRTRGRSRGVGGDLRRKKGDLLAYNFILEGRALIQRGAESSKTREKVLNLFEHHQLEEGGRSDGQEKGTGCGRELPGGERGAVNDVIMKGNYRRSQRPPGKKTIRKRGSIGEGRHQPEYTLRARIGGKDNTGRGRY